MGGEPEVRGVGSMSSSTSRVVRTQTEADEDIRPTTGRRRNGMRRGAGVDLHIVNDGGRGDGAGGRLVALVSFGRGAPGDGGPPPFWRRVWRRARTAGTAVSSGGVPQTSGRDCRQPTATRRAATRLQPATTPAAWRRRSSAVLAAGLAPCENGGDRRLHGNSMPEGWPAVRRDRGS